MNKFLLLLLLSASVYAADAPKFENVTPQTFDKAVPVSFHFWVGLPDVNGDGCFDAFNGAHSDQLPSAMYINDCKGNFTYYPQNGNYTQPVPKDPRISSRWVWGNWYGNPEGIPSFYGLDVDVSKSAKYPFLRLDGNKPVYASKSLGCLSASCTPTLVGDSIAMISRSIIRDMAGKQLVGLDDSVLIGSAMVLFDVNNDGYFEIVHPLSRGYWTLVSGVYEWRADKFPVVDVVSATSSGHMVPFDYDNDGDMDLYLGAGHYSPVGADTVVGAPHGPNIFTPYLFRNDGGNFINVSIEAGFATAELLKNTYYWSTYGNSVAVDVNNDGWQDIVYGAEAGTHNASRQYTQIPILLNNGNGTFTVDRSNNFGPFRNNVNSSGRPWVVLADYDNDGKQDLIKTAGNTGCAQSVTDCQFQSLALWRNTTANSNHWLRVRVQGKTTDGLHSIITVRESGSQRIVGTNQVAVFSPQFPNLIPHFGLGKTEKVDVTVKFPNGGPVYTHRNLDADQDIILRLNGDIVTHYTPGINPMLAVADAVEPPDEEIPDEEPPVEDPELSDLEKAQAEIAALKTTVEQLQADKIALSKANIDQAQDIAGLNDQIAEVNVTLVMKQEELSRAEQSLVTEKLKLETLAAEVAAAMAKAKGE